MQKLTGRRPYSLGALQSKLANSLTREIFHALTLGSPGGTRRKLKSRKSK